VVPLLTDVSLKMLNAIALAIVILVAVVALWRLLRRLMRIADGVGEIDNT
jgi:hypothetical protein